MAKPLSYHLAIVTKENENLQSSRYRLLSLLHVNKKDIRKYIQLAHTQGVPEKQMDELMKYPDGKSKACRRRRMWKNNIMTWYEQTHIDYEKNGSGFSGTVPVRKCEIANASFSRDIGMKDV